MPRFIVQRPGRSLLVLVGVSAALRAWASGGIPTPWIAPDELIYAELGRNFWQSGHFTLYGYTVGFFSAVYPIFAGLPLSLPDRVAGYELLKGLQAVVMSLTAIPVYLWGRRLVPTGWALGAAALALVVPGLAYSGLVMTEVAFYPVFVIAAYLVARAIETPTPRRQLVALVAVLLVCATRIQALLFVPAYLTAAALDAAAARDRRRLRAHLPPAGALVVLGLVWSGWQLRHGGPVTKVLGAYQAAGESGYSIGDALRYVVYHLGDLVFISGVIPFAALVVLAVHALRGREEDAAVRAFVATTSALSLWMAFEVGTFASRHVGHLAERNLFELLPLYALALVTWLARGAPRPRATLAGAAALAVLLLWTVPFEAFTTLAATPSAFTQIPLLSVTPHADLDLVVPLAAVVLVGVAAFVPLRALAVGAPLLLAVLGIVASVSASRFVVQQSKIVQYLTIGPDRTWVDDATHGSVTYVFSGQLNWEIPWQARFWNAHLDNVVRFLGTSIPGGLPAPSAGPAGDGVLVNDQSGAAIPGDAVAGSDFFTFVGDPVAHPLPGLSLWRADEPIRLRQWVQDVAYDGTVPSAHARVFVYACNGGTLKGRVSGGPLTVHISPNVNPPKVTDVAAKPNELTEFSAPVPKPGDNPACVIEVTANAPFVLRDLAFS